MGDHTVRLAGAMRGRVDRLTALRLHGPQPAAGLPFDRVDHWDGREDSLASLLRRHHPDWLWIQYSGYGYGYQGVPWYLVRALRALEQRPRIAVYFHEIHCAPRQLGIKGPILSRLQEQVGRSLAQLADVVLTSNELYRGAIEREYRMPPARIVLLPLGSNIPVPEFTDDDRRSWRRDFGWKVGERVAVAFGSAANQRKALQHNAQALLRAVEKGHVHQIICVGGDGEADRAPVLRDVDGRVAAVCTVLGHQSCENAARWLVAADVGLIGYPCERLGKSGVFMSYSLSGLPVLVPGELTSSACYRGARLISHASIDSLGGIVSDGAERIARHRSASEAYGWPEIARAALGAINVRHLEPVT